MHNKLIQKNLVLRHSFEDELLFKSAGNTQAAWKGYVNRKTHTRKHPDLFFTFLNFTNVAGNQQCLVPQV
jgi:hypothetical protein